MRPPDKGTRCAVCLGGDAASIDHDHIRRRRIAHAEPRRTQATPYRFAIGARRPASEILHVKLWHTSSLVPLSSLSFAALFRDCACAVYNPVEIKRGKNDGTRGKLQD